MQEKYAPKVFEKKIRERWNENNSFLVIDDPDQKKYYCLSMWPYPSGDLHVGHLRNYSIGDVWARHKRMQGFNVLQPMGWDTFGKDAELKARKEDIHPAKWVETNTKNMKRELQELGYMIDWSRELASCNPLYYYWEQYLFVKMWEKDLVYYAPTKILWDKATQTVTSRREYDLGKVAKEDVEVVEMPSYQMRMRKYGNELLEGLNKIKWPDKIVKDQQYLIGRSEGMSIKFALETKIADIDELEVYTTRPDTIMGVTYMAVHASHPLAKHAAKSDEKIAQFCEQASQVLPMDAGNADSEKNGLPLGINVLNPVDNTIIPVWVADYVIDDYGSGALMGVPSHDERDFNFATKYNLQIIRVCAIDGIDPYSPMTKAETGLGVAINSGPLDGLNLSECIDKLAELLGPTKKAWRDYGMSLRDWPINRQMYWGTPIPIIKCDDCGLVPVPEEDLPVILPLDVADFTQGLASHPEFVNTTCPKCKKAAKRECDTMDTFVNSAWYYARFTCRDATKEMIDKRGEYWLPCDHYFGGDEHAQGHLVYARFIHKVMRDLKLLPDNSGDEPFEALLCQGMVLGADRKKMSKSQDNTVMAKEILEKYGADIARMYIIGIGNPKDAYPWNDSHIKDHAIFLESLWAFAYEKRDKIKNGKEQELDAKLALQLKRLMYNIDHNINEQKFNNLIFGGIHSIRNLLKDNPDNEALLHQGFAALLKTLNLIAPHTAEELWENLGYDGLIIDAKWWDPITRDQLQDDERLYVVQVNGKRRDELTISADANDDTVLEEAKKLDNVGRYLEESTIKTAKVVRKSGSHGIVFFVVAPNK